MAKDVINRTEGLRRQAKELICQAYERGYKDGEADAEERHKQSESAEWLLDGELIYKAMICSKCGAKWLSGQDKAPQKYCHGCGRLMTDAWNRRASDERS